MRVASRRPLCSAHNAFVPGRALWKLFTSTPFPATPLLVRTRSTAADATDAHSSDDVANFPPASVSHSTTHAENVDREPLTIHRVNRGLEVRRRKLLWTMGKLSFKVYRELRHKSPAPPFILDNVHFPKESQSATALEYQGQNIAILNNSSYEEDVSLDSIPWMQKIASRTYASQRCVVSCQLERTTSGLTNASSLPACATK